jgi:hypothetical protein
MSVIGSVSCAAGVLVLPTASNQVRVRLGLKGTWAAPGCIAKLVNFREAERRSHQTNTDYNW